MNREYKFRGKLIKFQKKYGDINITENMWDKSYKGIEIYDSYRE